ncbi:chitobiase/beta-hexosaminidase C-terminal domain-containing protein [Bacillus luti]|uniref:chitobiase/beta-hexosaminidase C-terminal domain-containing protein n=1 Tax=Bacillus luti TaxID=2026191 RepID=UPI003D646BBD
MGDKKAHRYDLYPQWERGGVNADGSLNNNPNWIRTKPLDRYIDPGLLKTFRLWKDPLFSNVTGYSFFQYNDKITAANLVGSRTDGGFAPNSPTGRGWFTNSNKPGIAGNNKLVFAIDISNNALTDEQIRNLRTKVDNMYFSHEAGHGIGVYASWNVEIDGVEITECTGDGIITGFVAGKIDPKEYTINDIGGNIEIQNCNIHRNRRQGISLCGPNDVYVHNNEIHHIGYADDGVTTDFNNGIAPMFGIDIESMIGESNIPSEHPYYGFKGFESNFRILIEDNYVHHNGKGHFVNCDGNYVTLSNNTFEGATGGGISSYPRQMYIKYLNNTFLGCELLVEGDNYVNGALMYNANLKLIDCYGASINNIRIRDGVFYGNNLFGYFGSPKVDVETSTFTFSSPTLMGSGAKVIFEQWVGKVPEGISVEKVYYTVNATTYGFQVSETPGGPPVIFYDSGEEGFTVNRQEYGCVTINNVHLERSWRDGNAKTSNFSVSLAGGTIRNVTLRNYDFEVATPYDYVGKPNVVDNVTVYEGGANITGAYASNIRIIKNKAKRLGGEVTLGPDANNKFNRRTTMSDCTFSGIDVILFNCTIENSTFINAKAEKHNNKTQSVISKSYFEDSSLSARGVATDKSLLVAKCLFNNTSIDVSPKVVMVDNTDITTSVADLKAPIISVSPIPGIFNKDQSIVLTSNKNETTIYYTVDGTTPTSTSSIYSAPIPVSNSTTISVLGIDSAGNTSSVKKFRFNIDKVIPIDVTNLTAISKNDGFILSWTASEANDVVRYDVYNKDVLLKSVVSSVVTTTISGLKGNTAYELTVKTVDLAGNISTGTTITKSTTVDAIPPEEVTNLKASAITDKSIALTYTGSTSLDIDSYDIYKDGALIYADNKKTNMIISGLTPNTKYVFLVKAKDINGNVSVGVNVTVDTVTSTAVITDGLLLYMKDAQNNQQIENKDNYFSGNNQFTFTTVLKLPNNTDILKQYVIGNADNKLNFYKTSNQFIFNTYGTKMNSVSSPTIYNDDTVFYNITVVRNNTQLLMYINGVEVSKITQGSDGKFNESKNLPLILGHTTRVPIFKHILYYNKALTPEEVMANYNNLNY